MHDLPIMALTRAEDAVQRLATLPAAHDLQEGVLTLIAHHYVYVGIGDDLVGADSGVYAAHRDFEAGEETLGRGGDLERVLDGGRHGGQTEHIRGMFTDCLHGLLD